MEDVSACSDDSERGVDELLGTAADYFYLEHPELQSTSSARAPGWLHSGYRRARSRSLVGPTLELRIIRLSCNGRRKSGWMPEFFRHGVSASAAPVVFALKKDGKLRLCIDYRLLNAWTVRDHVPSGLHQSAQNSG